MPACETNSATVSLRLFKSSRSDCRSVVSMPHSFLFWYQLLNVGLGFPFQGGHIKHTYWYLEATPELMGDIAEAAESLVIGEVAGHRSPHSSPSSCESTC